MPPDLSQIPTFGIRLNFLMGHEQRFPQIPLAAKHILLQHEWEVGRVGRKPVEPQKLTSPR